MPGLSLLRVVLACCSFAWSSTPLANPIEAVPGPQALTAKLVMPANAWRQPSTLPGSMSSSKRRLPGNTPATQLQSSQQPADPNRLIQSVRMLDAGEQAFSAVAVSLPMNFLIGETEIRVGLGWIGAQNNKPAGDIAQGSAPQFAEQRFVESTRNSVVFLFTIPF